ncbi:hypothetical protein PANDA_008791 [Ailuropoda melanoleuca]|uniref:L-methionine (R)-S-oxide reductase n=1 Tax=Ailuropoda melanoleuca TaxID=9646 RepID=D2HDL3_AILME|nr:hypothetical protein PANDA_008791 [Ailuropoda melanoleuca]
MRDQQAISDMPAVPVDLSRPKQGQPALWKVRRGAVSQPTGLRQGSCRDKKNCKVVFSQQELRKRLTPLQYHVTQEKGTESAFEGEYTHHKDPGIYKCVVCGTPLFKFYEQKFESLSLVELMASTMSCYLLEVVGFTL